MDVYNEDDALEEELLLLLAMASCSISSWEKTAPRSHDKPSCRTHMILSLNLIQLYENRMSAV